MPPRKTNNSNSSSEFPVASTSSEPRANINNSESSLSGPSSMASPLLSPQILEAIQQAATQASIAALQSLATVPASDSQASSNVVPSPASRSPSTSIPSTTLSSAAYPSVPSFIPTFNPSYELLPSSVGVSTAASGVLGTGGGVPSVSVGPTLNRPFVVGPGISPVPAKLVSSITSGKFVDLDELLSQNLAAQDDEPQLLIDGRIVLTAGKRKLKRNISEIVAWMEAFTTYFLVLVSYFPNRWQDLTKYKLLILQTYQQLGGTAWLRYDKAFREHAAATNLSDWSEINSQLFNFHAAARNVAKGDNSAEASGTASSYTVCHSWNRGNCSAPSQMCKFAHRCSGCSGDHRLKDCYKQRKRKAGEVERD